MLIDELPLPKEAIKALKSRGIRELFPPQEAAVRAGLFEGQSIVLSAPTASGKTLVAVLAALNHVLDGEGKVLYLSPLRAIASEKYEDFSYFTRLGVKVALTTGDYDSSDPWLERYDVIVTTNEKADSLLRHRASWLKHVTLVVADEVHLINEARRGPTLEMLLARLLACVEGEERQLLALSATIKNLEDLASWLGAKPLKVDWRPVELREGVYYDGEVVFNDGRELEIPERENPVVDLVLDCLEGGGQALVFSSTRRSAVSQAKRLAKHVCRVLSEPEKRRLAQVSAGILTAEKNVVTELLAELVSRGVAFHHAGLSYRIRRTIEDAFRENAIKAIVATPTLAAGVNLPARRVIVSDYRRYNVELGVYEKISVMEYKQMAGRAGRPQYDKVGEAILIARTLDERDMLIEEYVHAEPERIYSKLASEPALRAHVLATVASGYASSERELLRVFKRTLYAKQYGASTLAFSLGRVLRFLQRAGFIRAEDGRIEATELGARTSQLYLDPYSAITIVEGLRRRSEAEEIAYLHLIASTPDMPKLYLRRREREDYESLLEHLEGKLLLGPPEDPVEFEFFLSSLKTACLLLDWIEERDEDYIIKRYDVGTGDIYSLTQTAEWLCYAARELAKVEGLLSHVGKLSLLRERVKHGVREELLELVQIKGVGRVRARILYNHGYRSLADLVKASEKELARLPLIGPTIARRIKAALEGKGLGEEDERARAVTLEDFLS